MSNAAAQVMQQIIWSVRVMQMKNPHGFRVMHLYATCQFLSNVPKAWRTGYFSFHLQFPTNSSTYQLFRIY